jgi:hypothetical protein
VMQIRLAVFAIGVLPLCAALSAPTCAATFNWNLLFDFNDGFVGQNENNRYSHGGWNSLVNYSTTPSGSNWGAQTCLSSFGSCSSISLGGPSGRVIVYDPGPDGESLGPMIINDPGPNGEFLGPSIITDPGPGAGPIIIYNTSLALLEAPLGSSLGPVLMDEPGPALTPAPATLPLFAGGLGLIGFLVLRRRRKASAVATA